MTFKIGDYVTHKPSGEEWIVLCDDGEKLLAAGYPVEWVPSKDCETSRVEKSQMLTNARIQEMEHPFKEDIIR